MKNLYGTISIFKNFNENNEQEKENINYYKIKNDKYGLEIEMEHGNQMVEKMYAENITEDERKIEYILKDLLKYEVTPGSRDVIEDLVKQYV